MTLEPLIGTINIYALINYLCINIVNIIVGFDVTAKLNALGFDVTVIPNIFTMFLNFIFL